MTDERITSFSKLVALSVEHSTLLNVVFSAPVSGDIQKVKGTLKNVSSKCVLQLEYSLTEGRVRQENTVAAETDAVVSSLCKQFQRCDLNDAGGNASLMTSKKGKITLIRHGKIGEGEIKAVVDEKKKYILNGDEEFLCFLGISDRNGRVHDKKQAKFRQINRFLEHVSDEVRYLPKDGEIRIADLCCGKSYLSFAVYHYFRNILGREVIMDCMDLKKSVMNYCADIAEKCSFDSMRFFSGDVTKYQPEKKPHMVISLHACDTATDIVLERAITLSADIILATPCCHRDLSRKLHCEELSFISANSILKSKFCDAATDALRVLKLESEGYIADAVELTDPDDTPKNVLIRARKSKKLDYGNKTELKKKEYEEALRFLTGVGSAEAAL